MANLKKTLDFQVLQKGQDFRKLRLKQWFSKWDRTIAAITAIIMFFMLLSFVIVNIENDKENLFPKISGAKRDILNTYAVKLSNHGPEICTVSESTKVTCASINSEKLVEDINKTMEGKPIKNYQDLNLVEITFKNNKIEKGWLEGIILNIVTLTLINCQLSELGDKSFSGDVFKNLKTLTISDTRINTFRRNIFEESQITTLQINYGTMMGSSFEENAFGALEQTLNTLQLQGCLSHNVLLNITGPQTSLTSLSVLDLRNNNLGKIQTSSFSKMTKLRQLYMSDSSITEIEPEVFASLNLEQLDLRNNELKTLPDHTFDNVKSGISIDYNPWNCDCDLVWLRDFFESHSSCFTDLLYCSTPEGPKSYKEVDFCSDTNSSTSTEISTTDITDISTISELTTTPLTPATQKVLCNEGNSPRGLDPVEPIDDYQILVRKGRVRMQLTHTADQYRTYTLTVRGNGSQYEIELENEETYLFCFLEPFQDTASPDDCGAVTTPPALGNRAWITNKFKIPLIFAVGGSLLAAVLISGIVVFYCIRQHPNLIKGNKRVIMVESQAADAIIMPKTYDEVNYRPPSLNSYSNGYLTPKYNWVYKQRIVPQHVRTISEHTAFVIPSESCRKGHYRRRTRVEHVTQSFDDHVYEPPPPLPPNHPSEIINFDCVSQSSSKV
ncbi:uncharacterized protein LOC107397875 isoform X2 [Tribolium castaneum]|uniref:uncharacterized protein LOC107397875 isoform X2 n=1 Tax=Tribolium castaneum TaxID=7070 RepID=UPI0030FE1FB9